MSTTTESKTAPLSATEMRPLAEQKLVEERWKLEEERRKEEIARLKMCQTKMQSFNNDFLQSYGVIHSQRSYMPDYIRCVKEIDELGYIVEYERSGFVETAPYVSFPTIKPKYWI